MEKKSKENFNEEDMSKIKNILLKENSNEYFKKFSKNKIKLKKNRKITENHTTEKQSISCNLLFLPIDEDEEVVIRSSLD